MKTLKRGGFHHENICIVTSLSGCLKYWAYLRALLRHICRSIEGAGVILFEMKSLVPAAPDLFLSEVSIPF